MRKLYLIMVPVFFLQACSMSGGIPFVNTPVPTSTATLASTPTQTPTITLTPRATVTPTIMRFPTRDPELPTETVVPIPLFIGLYTATPFTSFAPPTSVRPGVGFGLVTISDNKIYWGDCKPNKATIITRVDDPDEVISVVIFMQVKSAKAEDYTPWTTGNVMFNHGGGMFSYVLEASEVEGHNHYLNSWARFQLVATNNIGEEVGRTRIYEEVIAMSPCMCYDPEAGCPIVTPKP